ncbi:hypothetical protein YPPY103_2256, partial [Yersinia pestis PY-103]|jgi:hypothetical protein
MANQT